MIPPPCTPVLRPLGVVSPHLRRSPCPAWTPQERHIPMMKKIQARRANKRVQSQMQAAYAWRPAPGR